MTDRLCEGLLKTMIKEAPIAVKEPENYDARANIMWAGMLAHNNICGVGRVQDWASHHIEHELSASMMLLTAPVWLLLCQSGCVMYWN